MRKKKTKKNPDKRAAQTIHFKQRFLERHGIDPNNEMRREMIEMIRSGRCEKIRDQSLRITVFDVVFDGVHYPIVYDRKRKSLVTVLPQEEPCEG